jgi:hypothetical protein
MDGMLSFDLGADALTLIAFATLSRQVLFWHSKLLYILFKHSQLGVKRLDGNFSHRSSSGHNLG